MNRLIAILLFLVCASVGRMIALESWNGSMFVYLGGERSPASVRAMVNYLPVDHRLFKKTVPEQLVQAAALVESDGFFGVEMGHPLFKGGKFACDIQGHKGIYDSIQLVFRGEGVSGSNGPVEMMVLAPCVVSDQVISKLEPIWIPMGEIQRRQPKDQEIFVTGPVPATVKLQNVPDAWPQTWQLYSVSLFKEKNPDHRMVVDSQSILSARHAPFLLNWTQK